jgi:hypothetical protein
MTIIQCHDRICIYNDNGICSRNEVLLSYDGECLSKEECAEAESKCSKCKNQNCVNREYPK